MMKITKPMLLLCCVFLVLGGTLYLRYRLLHIGDIFKIKNTETYFWGEFDWDCVVYDRCSVTANSETTIALRFNNNLIYIKNSEVAQKEDIIRTIIETDQYDIFIYDQIYYITPKQGTHAEILTRNLRSVEEYYLALKFNSNGNLETIYYEYAKHAVDNWRHDRTSFDLIVNSIAIALPEKRAIMIKKIGKPVTTRRSWWFSI